jgi:hypothetical protein
MKEIIKQKLEKRIRKFAEEKYAERYTRLDIRFRGQFCYVDAYVEPEPPGANWPPADWPESREEYIDRLSNTPYHLFRLRYIGYEDSWELAFYSYAHEKYELSVFPTGEFTGTPEAAFETAAEFHL